MVGAEEERDRGHRATSSDDLADWVRLISGALACKHVPYVGIVLHFYSGNLATEDFRFRSEEVSAHSLERALPAFEEDVLYRCGAARS